MSSPDQPFTAMAGRIQHNEGAPFGGAAVLVAPDGTVFDRLFIGVSDEGEFWATILTQIQKMITEVEGKKAQHAAFGRPR